MWAISSMPTHSHVCCWKRSVQDCAAVLVSIRFSFFRRLARLKGEHETCGVGQVLGLAVW
jgi:hypothetical protein